MADLLKSTQFDNVVIEIYADKSYVKLVPYRSFIIQCYNSLSKKMYFQYVMKDKEPYDGSFDTEFEADDLYRYLVDLIREYECYKCGAVAFRLAEYPTDSMVITLYEGGRKIGIPTA